MDRGKHDEVMDDSVKTSRNGETLLKLYSSALESVHTHRLAMPVLAKLREDFKSSTCTSFFNRYDIINL